MSDGPEWFAPKRYGFGSGRPVSWQGWALTIGFVILVALASALIHSSWIACFSVIATLSAIFLVISARTTRCGWRWRWGDKD